MWAVVRDSPDGVRRRAGLTDQAAVQVMHDAGPPLTGPALPAQEVPPYGCLVQWHPHTNRCTSLATHLISGFAPCQRGYGNHRTPGAGSTLASTTVWDGSF